MIPGSTVRPSANIKANGGGKSANFRPAQIPGGITPAFKGFSFTKRNAMVISQAAQDDVQESKDSAMDQMIKDAFPEAEMDEILEE